MTSKVKAESQTSETSPKAVLLGHDPIPTAMPIFGVMLGRGGRGKTVTLRAIAEGANTKGRSVVICDGDRTNRTLNTIYDNVSSPDSASFVDVMAWLEKLIDTQIKSRLNILLDLGGGDQVLRQIVHDWDLMRLFAENGVAPLAIHLLGPDPEDLSVLAEMERDGLFAPERTVLVFNEAMVAPHLNLSTPLEDLFETQPVLRAAAERGGKILVVPRLEPIAEVDRRRLTFRAAAEGRTARGLPPLGPVKRSQISKWVRQMEDVLEPVAGWLP